MGLAGCVACCVLAVLPGNGGDCVRRFPPGPKASKTGGKQVKRVFGTIQRFEPLLPHSACNASYSIQSKDGSLLFCSGKRNQGHGLFFLLCSLPSSPPTNHPNPHKTSNPSPTAVLSPPLHQEFLSPVYPTRSTNSPLNSRPLDVALIYISTGPPFHHPSIQQCPISAPASSAQPHRLAPLSSPPSRSRPTSPRPILRMLPHNIIAVPFKWTSLS